MRKKKFEAMIKFISLAMLLLAFPACELASIHDKQVTEGPAETGGGTLQETSFAGMEEVLAKKMSVEYLSFERILPRINKFFEGFSDAEVKKVFIEKNQQSNQKSPGLKLFNIRLIESISKKTNKGLKIRDVYRKLDLPVIETQKGCPDEKGIERDGSAVLDNAICLSAKTLSTKIRLNSPFEDIRGIILHELGHKLYLTEEECRQLERLALATADVADVPLKSLLIVPMQQLHIMDMRSDLLYDTNLTIRAVEILQDEIESVPTRRILKKIIENTTLYLESVDRSEYETYWMDIYNLNEDESFALSMYIENRLSLGAEKTLRSVISEEKLNTIDLGYLKEEMQVVEEVSGAISMMWENFSEKISLTADIGFVFDGAEGSAIQPNIYLQDLLDIMYSSVSRAQLSWFYMSDKVERNTIDLCEEFQKMNLPHIYSSGPRACRDATYVVTRQKEMDSEGFKREMLKINNIAKQSLLPYYQREQKLYDQLCKLDKDYCEGANELRMAKGILYGND